jgi:hypothetical protein
VPVTGPVLTVEITIVPLELISLTYIFDFLTQSGIVLPLDHFASLSTLTASPILYSLEDLVSSYLVSVGLGVVGLIAVV